MRTFKMSWSVVGCSLAILATFVIGACATDQAPTVGGATTKPTLAKSAVAQVSGAQLWSDNCMRCHNLRSPETYSSSQWEVAVHHMRLRANLTGEETEKITLFLKSAN